MYRNFLSARTHPMVFFGGFFEPVLYLFSLGVGLGALAPDIALGDGTTVSYVQFVAPAMLASSAMNGAVTEATFNIFFKLKFGKLYDAMLATPMTPMDVAVGEIGWSQARGAAYSAGFLVIMLAMGLTSGWTWPLALLATALIGLAFGAVGMAATTFMTSWKDFDLVQLVILPMFLFSGTLYPLSVYPGWLQVVARLSPLYHGTVLVRGLVLGQVTWSMLGNVAVLVVMAAVGLVVARRRLSTLLLT
ncbi:ABC transporter permease [Nitriliruptoria bacterium AS10]|nr:ABC transporter permease [Salsipaludibacter albus]MBY5164134.1 ABC transporter permease [Salsipaludibacter albus]